MNEVCDIYYAQFGAYYRRGEIIMCDKIEELEKNIRAVTFNIDKLPKNGSARFSAS